MVRLRHDDEPGVGPGGVQPLGVGEGRLQVGLPLHDEHRLAHGADRRRRIERRPGPHEGLVHREKERGDLWRHVPGLLATEVMLHCRVVAHHGRAVDLPAELVAHHLCERAAQTGNTDHAGDRGALASGDQRQRRSLAVAHQHDTREPRVARE